MILAVNEQTFTDEVLKSPIPVLVNFWAPWCGLCRLVNPMLSELQDEWGGQIKLVSINADENLKLANTYRLQTLPTVMLFDGGKLLNRLDEFRSRDDFQVTSNKIQLALEALAVSYSYPA
ncbi:redoxin domain-containing protein [Oculatella sp. LEGE 06141]|uniref:thioredoxin family protein n=1 Tax=Oculatella sp. LEGE 06141 TaxID=1828648 RepID=UPI00187EA404|nr:thioredoxin domain-containing protein [Oculatella sp. LEGE 06141]MBE9178904.1 redoxin domain-containing protein [Oculatella sp. LEGE 06141]